MKGNKGKKLNYKTLGLKCGLELHLQLDTQHKLFCNCSTAMQQEAMMTVTRKQHPVPSELGEVDVAAQYEYLRGRTFNYQIFRGETCLVELDEEPPHELNEEALRIALQIALLLNCKIPEELHVMRKTVIDGSTPTGFQRTCVVGTDGFIRYKGKRVPIAHVCLEEDAAAIVEETGKTITYRLNRLGIPLVEISTGLLAGYNPEDVQEIAYLIGIVCKSTGRTKRGIGSIRQDVNVSIRRGARVEIKGVQELGLIAKVIQKEVERQLSEAKPKEETRAANPDGTTRYMRPLPGAHRLYPETDLPPVPVTQELLKQLKDTLPEPWTKKLARFKRRLKLSPDLARQILRSDYLELFERIVEKNKKVEPSVVANTFVSLVKDLKKREHVAVEQLAERHFVEVFDALGRRKIVKEAIPELLKYLAEHPEQSVGAAVKELELEVMKKSELKKIVLAVVRDYPEMNRDKVFGIVMSRVRGRAEAAEVMKIVKKLKKR